MKHTLIPLFVISLHACASPADDLPDDGPEMPTPADLWAEFQAVHRDATPTNDYYIGGRMDALLTDAARARYTPQRHSALRDMTPWDRHLPPDRIRQQVLSQSILARRPSIIKYRLRSVDTTDEAHATLIVEDRQHQIVLRLPVTREYNQWRFEASRDLLSSFEEAMPLPTSPARPRPTFATARDAANALVEAFNTEDGRLFYDLLDDPTRSRVGVLIVAAGDRRAEGPLRYMQKFASQIRAHFGTSSVGTLTERPPGRVDVRIDYATHACDTFTFVREEGWRLTLPL
jgi:hypothetical protein